MPVVPCGSFLFTISFSCFACPSRIFQHTSQTNYRQVLNGSSPISFISRIGLSFGTAIRCWKAFGAHTGASQSKSNSISSGQLSYYFYQRLQSAQFVSSDFYAPYHCAYFSVFIILEGASVWR